VGNICTNPVPDASVIVTFNATADAALGTPPAPATVKVTVVPAGGIPTDAPRPVRVSRIRSGVTGWNFDSSDRASETVKPDGGGDAGSPSATV
jgi:hypothetical protein